jgi:hypothetical protein
MESYVIRAALAEESNEGWVWMAKPSRAIVRISHPDGRRSVYWQGRDRRDGNFIRRYNEPPRRKIVYPDETIVMGRWYRDALGILGTTAANQVDGRADLIVKEPNRWGWGGIRSACHHPDAYVRLATRLGVLGAWLGVFGFMAPVANLLVERDKPVNDYLVVAVAVITGALGLLVCRGPRPARDRTKYD